MGDLNLSFIVFVSFGILGCCQETGRTEDQQAQTPAFSPEERYQDMFPLTKENFTESVMRNLDPWIVLFHDGSVHREWKTMATHLRGICWVGMVHVKEETELLQILNYDESEGLGRLYPYGDRKRKEKQWQKFSNPNEARSAAIASLPDKTTKMSAGSIHELMPDCFTSRPSRFPSILITDNEETPSVFKAIAKRFEKYFAFGKVVKPTSKDLKSLGLDSFYLKPPELFVLVTQNGKADKIDAIRFDKYRMGEMNYTSVMEFLFAINGQFRHDLPGDNMASHKQEMEMSDVIQTEQKRFEILRGSKKTVQNEEKLQDKSPDVNFKVTTHVGVKDEL